MLRYIYLFLFVLLFCGCTPKHSPMLQEFLAVIKENCDPESPRLQWESEGHYKVVYASGDLVSFKAREWRYIGGAHGMSKTTVGTFRKGKLLKLSDLSPRSELEKRWKKAIVRHFKAKSFEEHLKKCAGLFEPFLTENFYLDKNGIHFIYDPYEIDCFAAGTIDIFVPWENI